MREKKRGKRLLALLLACTLLVTSIPVQASPEHTLETSEGLEVQAGAEDPAGNTEGAEVPAEPESVLRNLERTVVLTEGGAVLEGIPDVRIRFYEQETFNPQSRENEAVAEVITEPDGSFELPELPEGVYRVAFQFLDPEQKAEEYQVIQPEEENGEEPEYQFAFPEEEEKEVLDCFAYIESYVVEEGSSLELKLEKKEAEPETTPEVTPETTPEGTPESEPETTPEATPEVTPETSPEATPETTPEVTPETTPEITPETSPEADPETGVEQDQEWKDKYKDQLPISELEKQEEAEVFATTTISESVREITGEKDWTFDAYYVNQPDDYHVEKTEDFNLKYQIEFHNSRDLEPNSVEIRIPRKLLDNRESKAVYPSDLAVPQGTPGNAQTSKVTPFNYYEDGEDLVFFNYEKIISGSNAAFQVLYKNLKMIDLLDGTSWSLTPSIQVSADGSTEKKESRALTGELDSQVHLSSVTTTPLDNPSLQYTPGLYTKEQVSSQLNHESLPEHFEKNFDNYRYVVWQVDVIGNANQAWSMYLKDMSSIQGGPKGEIVGISRREPTWTDFNAEYITTGKYAGYYKVEENIKKEEIRYSYSVVAAYPKSSITSDHTVVSNQAEVILVPQDKIDPDQKASASGQWTYVDYSWFYEGNTIGIGKAALMDGEVPEKEKTSKGWLDVYKEARNRGEDLGDFRFRTYTITNGYEFAHYTDSDRLGQLKPGMSYTMSSVDDFIYAFGSAGNYKILDSSDYYFSSVKVTQKDTGYDPWEDRTDTPEAAGGTDIYAMYKGQNTWEKVGTVSWNSSGFMEYEFTPEQLARQPWRVKAEHNTTNWRTECDIEVTVKLRHDSAKLGELLAQNPSFLKIENISGVMGWTVKNGVKGEYFQDQKVENGNYSEPHLLDNTKALYGCVLMRYNAFFNGTSLSPHAESHKTVETWNDPNTGRVNLTYHLTALDGYEVYGEEAVSYLESSGKEKPGRNEVVFYDLLPYGVKYDPSIEPTAGRITNKDLKDRYQSRPDLWDSSQVRVEVDSKEDIIPNYRETGRTMVRFHIYYDGADSTVYTNKMWMEGWGVSFGAYYEWKDTAIVGNGTNISAFMPARDDNRPLVGTEQEVAKDDGVIVPSEFGEAYRDFGSDIDEDGNREERTVLYAKASASDDVAIATSSKIEKLVKADDDRFGVFGKTAVVDTGAGYTYDITISNASEELKDIVIFDVLEDARNRRGDQEGDMNFQDDSWYGTFRAVDTKPLELLGIKPVIYYNADRNVELPKGAENPKDSLTEANGWYRKDVWEQKGYSASDVKAVAVDISKTQSGTDYVLGKMQSVGFQIQMTAPENFPTPKYAYNNSAYYSFDVDSQTRQTVVGNSTRVNLHEHETLEVEKEISNEAPEVMKDAEFGFTITRLDDNGDVPFASREYTLWRKDEQGVYQKVEGNVYATDAEGRFYLHDGEKAVFSEIPDVSVLEVKEDENPFWEVDMEENQEGSNRTLTFKNAYRPVLYLYKNAMYGPEDKKDAFVFQVKANGKPLANAEFWYVDRIRTDGGIPGKVTSLGNNGVGTTDSEGRFTIHPGEIVAVFPGETGTAYEVTEVEGYGDGTDWICKEPSKSGNIPVNGTSEHIDNIYKWKDLYITKTLTHQDPKECRQEFTFEIRDEEGKLLNGNSWVLMEGDQKITSGTVRNGQVTCQAAGRILIIKKLEAGKTYTVKETKYGDDYEPQNGGSIEVTMPVYASRQEGEIINDYLLRPVSVSKRVSYDQEDETITEQLKTKEFTMYIRRDGEYLSNWEYTVTKDGKEVRTGRTSSIGRFTLKHGETATFKDVGKKGTKFEVREVQDSQFPQIYPADGGNITGEIGREGASVTFVNGVPGNLLIQKEYVAEDNEGGKEYVESLKSDPKLREEAAVSFLLKVTENGNTYVWPETDTEVQVIDQLNGGTAETKTWKAGSEFTAEPWQTIEIPGLSGEAEYSLSEAAKDRHRVYQMEDGRWVEIAQTDPKEDQPVKGTVAENPMAVICNGVKELNFEGSEIKKAMLPGSEAVPEGAVLTWRLEQFNGTVWNPAEGVEYLIADEKGPACDRTLTTESDGLITLTKTANGYPRVRFLKEKVYVNLYSGMKKGDYRLVEVKELSDPEWGDLAGYEHKDGSYGFGVNCKDAVGFINSNRITPVEVEKKMSENSMATDESFTMILKQVVSASSSPITKPDQIAVSTAASGVEYLIYDVESGEQVGSGKTNLEGAFRLKAGQFVRFQLPDKTLWTVEEKIQQPYVLKTLEGKPPKQMTKLGDNLMLLNQEAEVIPVGLQAVAKKTGFPMGSAIPKENFTVTLMKSDGSGTELTPDQFEISPAVAPGTEGPFTVTITGQGYSTTVELEAIGTITLTKEMVQTGVLDAETGEPAVLRGEVVIPEQIIWKEKQYVVDGIGEDAFSGYGIYNQIRSVKMPDTITKIGNRAFKDCTIVKEVELPPNLTELGNNAFANCKTMPGIMRIPNGVKRIEEKAFYYCQALEGIVLPENLEFIGERAFYNCSNASNNLNLPQSVKEIGISAFAECSQLTGAINLPAGLLTLGASAFKNCKSLTGSVNISSSITVLEESVFENCSGLNGTVTLPGTMKKIGDKAFKNCSSLRGTLVIPGSVTMIGADAFGFCSGFSGLTIQTGGSGRTIGNSAFYACDGMRGDLTIPDGVTSVEADAFMLNEFGGVLTIPKSLNNIGMAAFYGSYSRVRIYQRKDAFDINMTGISKSVNDDLSLIDWLG